MSGQITNSGDDFSVNGGKIIDLADPDDPQDASSKAYVDAQIGSTGIPAAIFAAKGDILAAAANDTPAIRSVGADGTVLTADSGQATGLTWGAPASSIGATELIYRYTVAGTDKASIDTGADTPDAGSNDWTNGDVLEIFLYGRTDEAVAKSVINWTWNNDGSSIYDRTGLTVDNTTVGGFHALAAAATLITMPGASCASNVFGNYRASVAQYAGTVGQKGMEITGGWTDTTAANSRYLNGTYNYRSTSALTRMKIIPATAAKLLKVGTTLLIYKRLAS